MKNILAFVGLISVVIFFADLWTEGGIPQELVVLAILVIGPVLVVSSMWRRKRLEDVIVILIGIAAVLLYIIDRSSGTWTGALDAIEVLLTILLVVLGLGIMVGGFFRKK